MIMQMDGAEDRALLHGLGRPAPEIEDIEKYVFLPHRVLKNSFLHGKGLNTTLMVQKFEQVGRVCLGMLVAMAPIG
jgi:hypothetical protein